MNAQRFVTLILVLSLICFHASASQPDSSIDLKIIATTSTLKATHVIVGEVTDVSFVFEQEVNGGTTGPLSIVKARIVTDMKKITEDAENTEPQGETNQSEQFVSFTQLGGPYSDGGVVEAVGFPLLEVGDYVFLRLSPRSWALTHNGVTVESCIEMYGTVYEIDKNDSDDIANHVIMKAWKDLDLDVDDMTRVVRATLKNPDEMKRFERNSGTPTREALIHKISAIETALALPNLERQ